MDDYQMINSALMFEAFNPIKDAWFSKLKEKGYNMLRDEIDTETYFFDVSLVWGKMEYVFHKIKKDGTMSQINQHIEGRTIISIRKI